MEHVPTLMQVRAMAHFDGCDPSSYLLDPKVNFVPELPLGGEDPVRRHGLRFTGEDAGREPDHPNRVRERGRRRRRHRDAQRRVGAMLTPL